MLEECRLCVALTATAADEVIHDDGRFRVTTTMDVPGWVLVSTHRHAAQGIWSLTDEESAALGPLLRDVARAVRAATGAERTYLMSLGEHSLHFHVMVLGRTAQDPVDERGTALLATAPRRADADAARKVAAGVRRAMQRDQEPSAP